ncbi:MAG: ferrous iron transporter B [Deltaproteobacteria bacterium]|nr:ferrous iron transporter B [Deltaproteobacteria bacterium]
MSAACHDEAPVSEKARKPAAKAPPQGTLTIALVGRPNSGKSSLYNVLTGGDAHVGNYPGITVDILEGDVTLPSGDRAVVADLPGLYSVEATVDAGTDEGVARTFLDRAKSEHRRLVIAQVVDPTRLALGLRLTRELLRTGLPVIVVLTHKDVLVTEGHALDERALSLAVGAPVVLVSARDPSAKATVLAAVADRDRGADTDADAAVDFDPAELAREVVTDIAKESELRRRKVTERLDTVLLHPLVGPVLFLAIMATLFAAVFLVADPASGAMDKLVAWSKVALVSKLGKGLVSSFLADGVIGGAGTVLAFMPQIVILTAAMEVLEASGYLARGAFLVDRLLRVMGLSGRSFLPLLMGHACAVPAIAATRVVRDPRERLTTILVIPLMTCSARLPTYGLVLATFFAHRSPFFRAGLFVGLYFAGMLMALAASLVLRRTATKGKGLPLVLEIPAYRVPQARVVARKAWRAAKRFLRDVGTVIVAVAAVLWVLLTVPMPGSKGESEIESSVAASIGHAIEPVTKPAGFDWRIDVGLIGAFGAREVMVGTMGVIFGIENATDDPAPLTTRLREAKDDKGNALYTTRTGLALLAFFVIACQCMSTVAAIRRETKSWRWPAFVLAYTYALGYVAAVLVFQIAGVLGIT